MAVASVCGVLTAHSCSQATFSAIKLHRVCGVSGGCRVGASDERWCWLVSRVGARPASRATGRYSCCQNQSLMAPPGQTLPPCEWPAWPHESRETAVYNEWSGPVPAGSCAYQL